MRLADCRLEKIAPLWGSRFSSSFKIVCRLVVVIVELGARDCKCRNEELLFLKQMWASKNLLGVGEEEEEGEVVSHECARSMKRPSNRQLAL